MNIANRLLIIGVGRIGIIHGWALTETGLDVTHVVRKGRKAQLENPIELDTLDMRPGRTRTRNAVYRPRVVEAVSPADGYDLVMVATKHFQAADAVACEVTDFTSSRASCSSGSV